MTRHSHMVWGQTNEQQVNGEVVPEGEVWLIQMAGIATEDPRTLDYMLQVVTPPGWYVPVEKSTSGSTPVLALRRPLILQAGEFLRTRVNSGSEPFARMALLYSGWRFKASELPTLLGMVTQVALPDFSPMVAAAQSARDALEAFARSVA